MYTSDLLVLALLTTSTSAHGVVTMIKGANGVMMPGLSIADGTPRDCSTNRCGSQADTAIIRDREISSGQVGPLGRTQGNGPIDPATMIAAFMGAGTAPSVNATNASVGVEDDLSGRKKKEEATTVAKETMVAQTAGTGATEGLPTCADDGTIEMVFHQINQDGAGPMEAAVDGTSGGKDPNAFQRAKVTQDVPGIGFQGLSLATSTDFPLKVQMPAGMTCDATVAGVNNVCIVRVRNGAAAGPFGGSAAFTQSATARKRAVEYRLKKRAAKVFVA
ncbi:uncharacterized protein B0T15DRAFT_432532 [Chaetomium strumarium]|uniref:Cell surface protein n=1 Tax=Chaetomium strumarium TaxID=1170767 RepID=A0AAJ0GW24_9PEZI|nr:hypothetical protein B0T15DRAFT_432532 [Chaetomium strumarium]